jgi:hypothetical protein
MIVSQHVNVLVLTAAALSIVIVTVPYYARVGPAFDHSQ